MDIRNKKFLLQWIKEGSEQQICEHEMLSKEFLEIFIQFFGAE